jgi:dCMP deaminase
MSRPTREEALVETAFVWARRSTCSRLSVGAVIHREGRILSQGYNGAPAGLPHCPLDEPEKDRVRVHTPEECRAVHAEANAIAWAARHGVGLEGSGIVITHQPCLNCARLIINAGISSVVYVHPYRLLDGVSLLLDAGIQTQQVIALANLSGI